MIPSPTLYRALLATSGWLALAAAQLGPGTALRTAVTAVFLLSCPGAAALLLARPTRAGLPGGAGPLGAAAAALVLSAALTTLTAVGLALAGVLGARATLTVLACLTTLLAVLPRRYGPGTARRTVRRTPQGEAARRPADPRRRAAECAGAALLTLTAACGGGPAVSTATRPPQATAGPTSSSVPLDQPAAPGPWHSAFHDNFAGPTLDRADWVSCFDWNDNGCTNQGNHEDEWYRPGQVGFTQSGLTLTAERRATSGSDGTSYPWVSGMISTGRDSWNGTPRHTFTYGYFAAAIKAPATAAGFFPAFWLIPAEARSTPPEIDVAEFINTNQQVDMNLHYRTADGSDAHVGQTTAAADFATTYHVFAIDWEPDSVTWYVDGVQRFQVTKPTCVPHVAMELVLDLAVGFQEDPPASVDSAQLQVAWVGVWQH
ncbi:glycoside hydrolase family 16 protein [Kitasatospora sp. McL0602]|uniref:glycoside hydrolase family 16 protein n=1 Tax=Kitasatospora sp. McL0602 TaxID=3439530 RepID=UPI003F88DE5D